MTVTTGMRSSMTADAIAKPEPAPRFEVFRLTYPSGTVIDYYTNGSTLREVQVLPPMANVKPVEATQIAPKRG